jgi:hypothetical protein
VLLLEFRVVAAKIAATVRRQVAAALVVLLAVAEAGAENACDPLVPRQLDERLRVGDANQLGCLGPIPDILAVPVGEQVRGRAIDELKPFLSSALPMPSLSIFSLT